MMLSSVRWPVVASSANQAGSASACSAEDVLAAFDGSVDLLIDSGPTRYQKDSTIVRCANDDVTIVRKGVYDERMIRRLLRLRLLFVCTANACRSPIAAGLAKKLLADRLGCTVGELRGRGVEVQSAGLYAADGRRPTPEAVAAAKELGADIARHRTRRLTPELVEAADTILCMTDVHVLAVRRVSPSSVGKVSRLRVKGDIADPIGGGEAVYRQTAGELLAALEKRLAEIGF
jgi:protein-tyrosine phosphatase